MATFAEFWKSLKTELASFAEKSWKTYRDAAVKDEQTFLEKSKARLEEWTKQLAKKEISRKDFKWLVKGLKDLAELEALKEAGLAKVALDNFTNGLIDVVISTAFKAFL